MIEKIKQDKAGFLRMVIFSLCWGILAHGMALFNKFSFHDDVTYFNGLGRTYTSGRWMLGLMGETAQLLTGSMHYSTPVVKGLITILCLGIILYLVFSMLEIKDTFMIFLVSGLFVAFPAITGIFGYMFTAPYYYAAAMAGVVGVYIWNRKRNILSAVICIFLMACATGTYQANLPICVCALVLTLLDDIYHSEASLTDYVKKAVSFMFICGGSVAVYVILGRVFARIHGVEISGYKGISNMGMTGIGGYAERILTAYRVFFLAPDGLGNMFPFSSRYFHLVLIIVCMILAAVMLAGIFQKSVLKGCVMTFIFIIFPLMADLIYVMVGWDEVHGLMTYAEVFVFILAAWLRKSTNTGYPAVSLAGKGIVCLMAILLFMNIRFDNICYAKAEVLQTQAIGYFNVLAAKITSLEEYTPETPVVYIGEYKKEESGSSDIREWFEPIRIFPYTWNSLINDLKWKKFMAFWCSFDPTVGSPDKFEHSNVVKNMPNYPKQGSVRYIDGSIVVKFADN